MNLTRSYRHTYLHHSVSSLYSTKWKTGASPASNSENNTYDIEISEALSDESYKIDESIRHKRDDSPFFESYYPSFFHNSSTETSSLKSTKKNRSEGRILEIPSVATYYCGTHGKTARCPKKCSTTSTTSSSQSENQPQKKSSLKKISTPKCSAYRTRACPEKNSCEKKKSECDAPKLKKKSTVEFKLPLCDCGKCEDDGCDGSGGRKSGTYLVSSESDSDSREKRKCCSKEDDKREENPEKRVKRDACCSSYSGAQPYFQHYRDKLCGLDKKKPDRKKSFHENENCHCSRTSDRLKEISRRIEALEAIYQKQKDSHKDLGHKSSKHKTRESGKNYDEDRQSRKAKKVSSRTSSHSEEEEDSLSSSDPDKAKTAEEIEKELLEIRRRLQKLEVLHHERERSKARSVTSLSSTTVPAYTAVVRKPETKWRQITEGGSQNPDNEKMADQKVKSKNKAVEVNSKELNIERREEKEPGSNQSFIKNFIAACKIFKGKLRFLVRSERKKGKPKKSKKRKDNSSSSVTKISSSSTIEEKDSTKHRNKDQLFYLIPASPKGAFFGKKSKTKILYTKNDKIHQGRNMTISDFSSETPALSCLTYENDENKFSLENRNWDSDRNVNLNYLASGDTSSNSVRSVISYHNSRFDDMGFTPGWFDFTSNENYPFFKKMKKDPSLKIGECPSLEKFLDWNDPSKDLDSAGDVKIPVLFEELCKDTKTENMGKHPNMYMRLVMVATENQRGSEAMRSMDDEDGKNYAFGVSKCNCGNKDTRVSSIHTSQQMKSQDPLLSASNESLKSEEIINERKKPNNPPGQTTRCCFCNQEYTCPNAANHINPPNLIGLKRTLRDMGFVSLSEKLGDKIEFKKLVRKTKEATASSFKKMKRKSSTSWKGKNQEESERSLRDKSSGMRINEAPDESNTLEGKKKSFQSSESLKGNGKNSRVPVIEINIRTSIMGDPKMVKDFTVTTEEPKKEARRGTGDSKARDENSNPRVSFEEKPEKANDEKKNSKDNGSRRSSIIRKTSPASLKDEGSNGNKKKSSKESEKTLNVIREDSETKPGQIEIRGQSTGDVDLEIILDKNKESEEEVKKITSVDSVEVHKKRKPSKKKVNTSSSASSENESLLQRIQELESRLNMMEEYKKDDANSVPKSVKFDKNKGKEEKKDKEKDKDKDKKKEKKKDKKKDKKEDKNSKTVFFALLRPFKTQSISSKTKLLIKSSAEKLSKTKSQVKILYDKLNRKKSDKKLNETQDDYSEADSGFIDDCSRSSPALSERHVPLVMSSLEPIRPGKRKSNKKKRKKKLQEEKAKKKRKKGKGF